VLNAAVATKDDIIHIFYRAFGPDGELYQRVPERPSCIGHATNIDGIINRIDKPMIINAEDPRITDFGGPNFREGPYVMTYTEVNGFIRPDLWETDVAISVSNDLEQWQRLGLIQVNGLEGVNKNIALFPEKINGRYAAQARSMPNIYTIYSDNLIHWDSPKLTMQPREGYWDNSYIGTGIPPIKTEKGWLCIYHGVDENKTYRLGVALLDLNDPSIVLARSKGPLLEPKENYEMNGIDGNSPHKNVIYSCGGVIIGDNLHIYYGAADQVLALATVPIKPLLDRMST